MAATLRPTPPPDPVAGLRRTLSEPLDLAPNEASGLCPAEDARLLERLEADVAYWTVMDDVRVERAVALLVRRPDRGWSVHRLEAGTGSWPKTEDGEAIARRSGTVYVVGSQYGSKDGPLQKKRSFVARFPERAVAVPGDGTLELVGDGALEVAREPFLLHRLVNDALRRSGLPLLDPGPEARGVLVHGARSKATKKEKPYAWRLRWDDLPVNVEGAAFLGDILLLGLRFPVTASGAPLVGAVSGIDAVFEGAHGDVAITAVWAVLGPGAPDRPSGVRDLHVDGDGTVHLLTGNLDSSPERSTLLTALPEGRTARSGHWRCRLPGAGGRWWPNRWDASPSAARWRGWPGSATGSATWPTATTRSGPWWWMRERANRIIRRNGSAHCFDAITSQVRRLQAG